ncbi:MAG: thioredoxin family protein [Bacteroidia bacterium]|nr:thioredoxin family protein [Bacteroidia bacterium]
MKKITLLALILSLGLLSSFVPLGEGYKVGDKVQDFNLRNVDGTRVSLAGQKEAKGFIVIFTCNHCPFSVAYEDRIIALHQKYAPQGYPVIAINPNDAGTVPEDDFESMMERAREKKFPFAYLHDESQDVARAFGAARTPHVFVIQKDKGDMLVKYIGAIDDNTDDPSAATRKYVENAMEELIKGELVSLSFTKAIGCTIKWKK